MSTTTVYDAVEVDISLPPKPAKQQRKAAAPKPVKEPLPGLAALQPPTLQLPSYASVGQCFRSRIHDFVNYSPEREAVMEEAFVALAKQGVSANVSVIDTIKHEPKEFVTETGPDGKPVQVSKYTLYSRTEKGKEILAQLRETDAELKSLTISLAKNYVKSTSGGPLYTRWNQARDRKIITDETYHVLQVLSKYTVGELLRALIQHRVHEIRTDRDKHHRIIEVSTDTVRSMLAAPVADRKPVLLSSWFYSQLAIAVPYFVEPPRLSPKERQEAKEAKEAEPAEEEEDDDEINITNMINEIIQIVRKDLTAPYIARNEAAPSIRTTGQIKKLLNHIVMQFCDKALRGIHVYVSEAKKHSDDPSDFVGVKIDLEELQGRLLQMIFDSTDSVFMADKRVAESERLRAFIAKASADYEVISQYREKVNNITWAHRLGAKESKEKGVEVKYTVESMLERREANAKKAAEKELAKNAAAAGLTPEAYLKQQAARRQERQVKSDKAKEARAKEDAERLEKDAAKLEENDKKWRELLVKYNKIIETLRTIEPPPKPITIGGSVATAAAPAEAK